MFPLLLETDEKIATIYVRECFLLEVLWYLVRQLGLIHSEFIFVDGVREHSNFILFRVTVQFPSTTIIIIKKKKPCFLTIVLASFVIDCVCMLSCFNHVQLFATLMDCSPPGSSAHEILQARMLQCVAVSSSKESSQSRDWTHVFYVSCFVGGLFTAEPGHRLIDHIYVGLFMGSLFCSIDLCVFFCTSTILFWLL